MKATRILWLLLFCATSLPLAPRSTAGSEGDPGLRAGAACVDITPQKLPVRVNGGFTQRIATEVKDPLHARGIVLDDGSTRIALTVVDSCLMPRDLLDRAKKRASETTGIPPERMLISATHTHTAPAVMGVHGTDAEPEYAAFLERKIAECITSAAERLVPARIGWATGRCNEFVFCRRWIMKPGTAWSEPFTGCAENTAQMNPGNGNTNKVRPTGPVDPDVTVVSVQTREGRPLALLANYSTHYAGSSQVSADYFGEFARLMTEKLGMEDQEPAFVALMSNGTSGDANCIDFSKPERVKFTHEDVARSVAAAAYDAYGRIEHFGRVPVAMLERRLKLSVRMPGPEEVTRARAWLEEQGATDRPVKTRAENYARETVLLSGMPPTRELELQAIRIGDLALAAIPCEVYGRTGLAIKKESPFGTTVNISMANGAEGYIPPPEEFPRGGYTTWRARSSCLEENAEPKIRAALLEMLRSLKEGGTHAAKQRKPETTE